MIIDHLARFPSRPRWTPLWHAASYDWAKKRYVIVCTKRAAALRCEVKDFAHEGITCEMCLSRIRGDGSGTTAKSAGVVGG